MSVQTDEAAREMFHLIEHMTRAERFDALQALMERMRWDEENKAPMDPGGEVPY